MKKDRIVINRQMLLLPVVLLLSSCVTFRPDFYDSETKTYNNYKNNYSVKILDDFEFTTKDSIKDPFSRSYVSQLPLNAKFVYNKEYPIFITFFEYQNASVKFYQRFIQNKDNMEVREGLKEGFLKVFKYRKLDIVDLKMEDINGFISFDFVMDATLVAINQNLGFTAFMVEQQFPKANFFVVNILCFPSHEEIAKEKYIEFLNGIKFHAFSEDERRK